MPYLTFEKLNKLHKEVRKAIYRQVREIPAFKFCEKDVPGAHRPDFHDEAWDTFHVGQTWGGYDVVAWFRARVPIPDKWRDRRLYLRFLVGPRDGGGSTAETLLYVNGVALQGLDRWHSEAWLPPELLQEGEIHVALKAWSGVLDVPDRRRFKVAQLIWVDEATERFYHLTNTLLQTVEVLDEHDLARVHLLRALDEAFRRLAFVQPGSDPFYRSVQEAYDCLQKRLDGMREASAVRPRVTGIGHAHLDMAWLWRLAHTREKAVRTFTTALHLMRQYPEYRFMHSSPQLYRYIQQDHPRLFEQIKERVEDCQWEVTGGMWIESDVNMPSGESLVRQFLLGQAYIRREFGQTSRLLWLPDVFGFSWALPQIARKSGIDYFLSIKMSWNQFNQFPYHTFRWRGIDGSELLSHFVTAQEYLEDEKRLTQGHTYNAGFYPIEIKTLWENYNQKDVNDDLLFVYGRGDGGGGPTKEMLEAARAMSDLPGFPSATLEKAEPYFARLAQRVARAQLPVWDGELYPEFHRGTFTSQAFNKRANRKAEALYHTAEWLNALVDIMTGQKQYPDGELRRGWELILLNQFHDIITGSSIHEVYEDSRRDYEEIEAIGQAALSGARDRLVASVGAGEEGVVVFNPLAWVRDGLICLPYDESLAGKTLLDEMGELLPSQVVGAYIEPLDVMSRQPEDGEQYLLLAVRDVPALGYATYRLGPGDPDSAQANDDGAVMVTPDRLENRFYRIKLNERGQIISLWDRRRQRQVLAQGQRGNVLQAFMDKPLYFDAWDIDIFYQDKMDEVDELLDATVEEDGPLRGVLRLRWRYYDSTITQRLTVYRDSPRIDFRTEVDWQQEDVLLKVAFPVDVRATRATYDIQFGAIERPTHWNTSWDYARFEVAGHKWADLSEGDYGVALLNDCKYGYDVKDNVLRLTLIKSARWPDPQADRGHHQFAYALLPHEGDWRSGGVVAEGYELNMPLLAARGHGQESSLPPRHGLAAVDADHVILETVKKAEAGDAWIVRLYESRQSRNSDVTVTFDRPLQRATACNLIEEEEEDPTLRYDDRQLTFGIKPFEIKTFKVWFEGQGLEIG